MFHVTEAPVADCHKSHAWELINCVSPKCKNKTDDNCWHGKHVASELEILTFLETIM